MGLTSLPKTLLLILLTVLTIQRATGQTEGDTGYDYNDAYEDEFYDESAIAMGPTFDVPVVNVTVVIGQTALLPCSIQHLGRHKVAWLDQKSFPLTYEDRRVIDDSRFSLTRPDVKEWNLQIREVRLGDEGLYRCTVNTNPIRNKLIKLFVRVPPSIADAKKSSRSDVVAQEGDTVTLWCMSSGTPSPQVTWYRCANAGRHACTFTSSDTTDYDEQRRVVGIGHKLVLSNISRDSDDVFACQADNGVPPIARKTFRVTVEFAPEITMPATRLGQARGRETILECRITAYPHAVNYWEKDGQRIISSSKYRIEAYDDDDNKLTLSLRIADIDADDYGRYDCVAANALGTDQQTIHLFEYVPSEMDALDKTIMQQWTRNRVLMPTSSAMATRRRNHHRRVDHLHGMHISLRYYYLILGSSAMSCDCNGLQQVQTYYGLGMLRCANDAAQRLLGQYADAAILANLCAFRIH